MNQCHIITWKPSTYKRFHLFDKRCLQRYELVLDKLFTFCSSWQLSRQCLPELTFEDTLASGQTSGLRSIRTHRIGKRAVLRRFCIVEIVTTEKYLRKGNGFIYDLPAGQSKPKEIPLWLQGIIAIKFDVFYLLQAISFQNPLDNIFICFFI